MSKFCPIVGKKVVYLTCQECDDKACERQQKVFILPKREQVAKSDTAPCQVDKTESPRDNGTLCSTCIHKTGDGIERFGQSQMHFIYCEVHRNILVDDNIVTKNGCEYHNKDMSQEKICMNCAAFLGGGDWGLSCSKRYHTLTTSLSKACDEFEAK